MSGAGPDALGGGVWLARDGSDIARPDDPQRELARSATIEARSLRLDAAGRVLTWRQNGELHRIDL